MAQNLSTSESCPSWRNLMAYAPIKDARVGLAVIASRTLRCLFNEVNRWSERSKYRCLDASFDTAFDVRQSESSVRTLETCDTASNKISRGMMGEEIIRHGEKHRGQAVVNVVINPWPPLASDSMHAPLITKSNDSDGCLYLTLLCLAE